MGKPCLHVLITLPAENGILLFKIGYYRIAGRQIVSEYVSKVYPSVRLTKLIKYRQVIQIIAFDGSGDQDC